MDKNEIVRQLKGAAASCLIAMIGEPAMGEVELARITGYNRKTVRDGLRVLAKLQMAQRSKHFSGWTPTNQGYQLVLNLENPGLPEETNNGEILPNDGVSLPIDGASRPNNGVSHSIVRRSSSSFKESYDSLNPKELLLLELNGEPLPNEGEILPIAEILVKAGCPRRTAQPAIEAALKRGETPEQIEQQINNWLAYCQSDAGIGINNPPLFVAAKVKNGEPAPRVAPEEKIEAPYLVEKNEKGHLYSDGTYR